MAISLVQTANNSNSNTTALPVVLGNTTTGNTIIVGISKAGTALVASVTDSLGNTYASVYSFQDGFRNGALYYAFNVTGGTTPTVTINSAVATGIAAVAREYSGLSTTNPLDVSTNQSQNTATPTSGNTATTTQADELIVGVTSGNSTITSITAGSGFGNIATNLAVANARVGMEDKIVSTTGVQAATFSTTSAMQITGVGTFKQASVTPPIAPVNNYITYMPPFLS